MADALGPRPDRAADAAPGGGRDPRLQQAKKKGCKQKKCSNWKGGKCRCGRD
jgi:hypothetical protein